MKAIARWMEHACIEKPNEPVSCERAPAIDQGRRVEDDKYWHARQRQSRAGRHARAVPNESPPRHRVPERHAGRPLLHVDALRSTRATSISMAQKKRASRKAKNVKRQRIASRGKFRAAPRRTLKEVRLGNACGRMLDLTGAALRTTPDSGYPAAAAAGFIPHFMHSAWLGHQIQRA